VVDGLAVVDKIKRGDPTNNGKVYQPDRILSMRMASDVQ
jgi:cyclophilin family peptidyl-prolyl cis-trans isomerase